MTEVDSLDHMMRSVSLLRIKKESEYCQRYKSRQFYVSTIYPSEFELKDISTSTTEVCYLDTRIKFGDHDSPFHVSIYDKRDDFLVNFPHMDRYIPTKPAYGVYISQVVRYTRILLTNSYCF